MNNADNITLRDPSHCRLFILLQVRRQDIATNLRLPPPSVAQKYYASHRPGFFLSNSYQRHSPRPLSISPRLPPRAELRWRRTQSEAWLPCFRTVFEVAASLTRLLGRRRHIETHPLGSPYSGSVGGGSTLTSIRDDSFDTCIPRGSHRGTR